MIDLSNKRDLYNIYKKKKSNGRFRTIFAPKPVLKAEQERIAKQLEQKYSPPDYVFGFIKGRSAVDAAKMHTNKDWVISMDIKDFFPSIKKEMLTDILTEYEAEVCTYENKLVQGSPCSPVISNIKMFHIDDALCLYFFSRGICYTRYADDIILSGKGKASWSYVNEVKRILEENGFELASKKTKFMLKKDKQEVLGITVNTGVSINQKQRKLLRAKIHQGRVTEHDEGYLSYLRSVNKQQYNKLKESVVSMD